MRRTRWRSTTFSFAFAMASQDSAYGTQPTGDCGRRSPVAPGPLADVIQGVLDSFRRSISPPPTQRSEVIDLAAMPGVPSSPTTPSPPGSPTPIMPGSNHRERRVVAQEARRVYRAQRRHQMAIERRREAALERHRAYAELRARFNVEHEMDRGNTAAVPYRMRQAVKAFGSFLLMPVVAIAGVLGLSKASVSRILREPATPTRRRYTPRFYGTPIRERLVEYIDNNEAEARQMTYTELAFAIDTPASASTIRRLMNEAGFRRCVAQQKPLLSRDQREKRLQFARAVQHLTVDDWMRVIWTDECAFHRGGHQRVFVTRRPHERFHPHCILPRFKRIPHTMIWGSFAGGCLGPVVFWDRSRWGTVTSASFLEHIYPHLKSFYDYWSAWVNRFFNRNDGAILVMDKAPSHWARATRNTLEADGIVAIEWPGNSPDLNLIEAVWKRMKERIARRRPRPYSQEAMVAAVREEWQAIPSDWLMDLVSTMPQRVQDVIAADGGYTAW